MPVRSRSTFFFTTCKMGPCVERWWFDDLKPWGLKIKMQMIILKGGCGVRGCRGVFFLCLGDTIWIIHAIIDPRGVEFGWRRNLNCICWKTCFIYVKTSRTSDESGLEMPKPVYLQGWTVQSQVLLLEPTCSRFWNIFQWTCFMIQTNTRPTHRSRINIPVCL